ncbi:hypothetical protein LSTR_LSTR010840 [Laodelphax striatellus]|uniref:Uncharacterized protein n=1 Tax=Laodelphax striatellus TaxID=195883 RepID=A0A482WTS6_LAOST|nr:hypothetical protein LSTR_LSTR010840 [Laodelphax striatellus]
MLSSVEKDLEELSLLFFTFPKQQGLTLRSILRKWLKQIVYDFDDYFKFLLKKPVNKQSFENDLKHVQAVILKSIEQLAELPADNRQATITILLEEEALINDAFEELREEMSAQIGANAMGDDVWNNKQFETVEKGMDVLKTVKALCNKLSSAVKTNGKCSTENQISQLDDLVDTFKKLSPAVDDFISSLYPPTIEDEVKEYVICLRNVLNQLLNQAKVSHYITESDMQWVNFLGQAVTHNCSKIDSSISSPVNNVEGPLLILNNLSLDS